MHKIIFLQTDLLLEIRMLQKASGDDTLLKIRHFTSYKMFKEDTESVKYKPRSDELSSSTDEQNFDQGEIWYLSIT